MSAYWTAWYWKNRDRILTKHRAYVKKWRADKREKLHAIKDKPCADCKIKYPPYIMQFDHVGIKSYEIDDMITGASYSRILKEVEQCEVVCANCHIARTYKRAHA